MKTLSLLTLLALAALNTCSCNEGSLQGAYPLPKPSPTVVAAARVSHPAPVAQLPNQSDDESSDSKTNQTEVEYESAVVLTDLSGTAETVAGTYSRRLVQKARPGTKNEVFFQSDLPVSSEVISHFEGGKLRIAIPVSEKLTHGVKTKCRADSTLVDGTANEVACNFRGGEKNREMVVELAKQDLKLTREIEVIAFTAARGSAVQETVFSIVVKELGRTRVSFFDENEKIKALDVEAQGELAKFDDLRIVPNYKDSSHAFLLTDCRVFAGSSVHLSFSKLELPKNAKVRALFGKAVVRAKVSLKDDGVILSFDLSKRKVEADFCSKFEVQYFLGKKWRVLARFSGPGK